MPWTMLSRHRLDIVSIMPAGQTVLAQQVFSVWLSCRPTQDAPEANGTDR
jgi:hypothetical protein